ncbi:DUF4097 family beta strand repeat-containing protein [Dyadobacter sp. LHD-138]|uniref:DUF4097 family beta strand repeat-containing protein n=1 Tax=Dyadobacter sp. LHD-138 TaxID=3071413 RepID=UPI0027E043E3|nr:DUF4097 family beta strand repeat-containing protein [Dyadobacter sp. LHD-138]MDQ6481480.1 hypothetical protein [Dyadobacter sp. LHD-138]
MKKIIIPFLVGLVLSCTQAPAQKQVFKEHISKQFTVSNASGKNILAIYNINGFIKVKGYDGDKVMLEVDKTLSAEGQERLNAAKEEFKLNFEQKEDSILAYIAQPLDTRPNRGNQNWGSRQERKYDFHLEFTVKVPYSMNLQISTVNGGEVTVDDVTGSLKVSNVNGAIKLTNAKGASEIRTINGNVEANYVGIPPGESQFKTLNGDIIISYPQNLSADCQFKSFRGDFYTDFPNTETLPARIVKNQETSHNKTVYKLNAETSVRIGNGGKIFKFETFNGNIYLKKQS